MPTSEYKDDEVEELYDVIEELLEEDGKGETNAIIMGDWNSVVGDKAHHNIDGSYGLGRRNQRGQILIDVCERNGFVLTNTCFKKHKRRLDYVLVKQRLTNSVKNVQTLPGADTDSDHKLLIAKICTSLKKITGFQKRKPRWDLENLYA
jgi:exonuclease III